MVNTAWLLITERQLTFPGLQTVSISQRHPMKFISAYKCGYKPMYAFKYNHKMSYTTAYTTGMHTWSTVF